MGKVPELEPEPLQFIPAGFGGFFRFGQEAFQHFPVFQQSVVDVPDQGTLVALGFLNVVVVVAAIIVAEFLIDPAPQYGAAGQAGSGCCGYGTHFSKVYVPKIQLIIRVQTVLKQ